MGQYHKVVNLDKKEYLHPHELGDGLKLMEFGASAMGTMTALALLLACSNGRGGGDFHNTQSKTKEGYPVNDVDPSAMELIGSWAGCRIAIVGDYAEDQDMEKQFHAGRIYTLCDDVVGLEDRQNWARSEDNGDMDNWAWVLEVEEKDLYKNISPMMRALLESSGEVVFSGSGWLDKKIAWGR